MVFKVLTLVGLVDVLVVVLSFLVVEVQTMFSSIITMKNVSEITIVCLASTMMISTFGIVTPESGAH